MARKRKIVGVKLIAKDCGITERQIWNLVRDKGMPQVSKGRFDREAVREWWGSYKAAGAADPRLREAEIRLKIVQAEAQELKLAAARGEYVHAELVKRAWQRATSSFRSRILAMPRRAVPRLRGASGDAAKEKVLSEIVHEALDELCATDYSGIVNDAHADILRGGSPAPAGPDGQPVGRRKTRAVRRKLRTARKVED